MKKLLDTLVYRGVSLLSAGLAKLPARAALALGYCLGVAVYFFSRRRFSAYADLKAVFGERFSEKERQRIVRRHYGQIGKTALEIIRFPSLSPAYVEKMIQVHHIERFYNAMSEKRGVVLLTAHFGNWELLQIVSGILGHPIHVLAQDQKFVKFNDMLNQLRESHGSKAVAKGMGIRELYRALREGKLVGLLGDRDAGKSDGVILPFFGRKTSVPTGAFEMARRTGAPILPCLIVRKALGKHEIFVEEPIDCGTGSYEAKDLIPAIQSYLRILEEKIAAYPEQWLWANKRWKYTWTKKILILSDGKKGHLKQAESIAARMASIKTQYGRPGMEYPTEQIEVRYRSPFHRKLFAWVAFILRPWIQGRLRWLGWFFEPECFEKLRGAYADFVISAGSSLIPLNLCLAKECRAKSIVLMKPSFPFNFLRYDLAVIPAHDSGRMPKENIRTLLAPHFVDEERLQRAAELLRPQLKKPARIKFGIFLGGDTKNFRLELSFVEKTLSCMERIAESTGDYMLTTSRRTSDAICYFLKKEKQRLAACQFLVIASEDSRPEVADGMMTLADILIVTEDSISMISEAVSLGKKVIVLTSPQNELPAKHQRFRQFLAERSAVTIATPANLEEKLRDLEAWEGVKRVLEAENAALQEKLEAIL